MKTKFCRAVIVQGNFGSGWEDVCCAEMPDGWSEARKDLKDYRENDPKNRYRVIRRRVTREAFKAGTF